MEQPPPSPPSPLPVSDGRVTGLVRAVQGLTISNVLVIFLLTLTLAPAYLAYKVINDENILDRILSEYEEKADQSGCMIRHVKTRGGNDQYAISSGFAVQGVDRYFVSVIRSAEPTPEEIESYCESIKLIADRIVARGDSLGQ